MKTKKLLVLAVCAVFSFNATAETCISRTSSHASAVGKFEALADIRPLVTRVSKTKVHCSITARVLYDNKWESIAGGATGLAENVNDVCAQAVKSGAEELIGNKETLIHTEVQNYCTNEKPIETRPVKVGEVIHQSEVVPDPDSLGAFPYSGTMCRRFVVTSNDTALITKRGVICSTGRASDDLWTVVDLY